MVSMVVVVGALGWLPGVPRIGLGQQLPAVDAVVMAVRDDVISSAATRLQGRLSGRPAVLHTSGRLDSSVLTGLGWSLPCGSFHPLQSFVDPSAGAARLRGCFVAVEGDPEATDLAERLALTLGAQPVHLTGDKAAYHAAAVVAANYLVCLTEAAVRLCGVAGIDEATAIAMLGPLQRGALANLAQRGLPDALTGPVSRGDGETVEAHIDVIARTAPELTEMYRVLGHMALDLAGRQGLGDGALAALAKTLGE